MTQLYWAELRLTFHGTQTQLRRILFPLQGLFHCAKKPVTTMLTYPWKCSFTRALARVHPELSGCITTQTLVQQIDTLIDQDGESDNQSVRSSAPVVSRCFPGGYNVKLYISRGRLAWWWLFCAVFIFIDCHIWVLYKLIQMI